jgi:integrase
MQGHIRKRGRGSWEYIIDIGPHPAQRCSACYHRFWVERRPKAECPRCGGRLAETEERRRQTKAGFATRKEAQVAMNKTLVAVEEHTYVAPTHLTLREYLTKEWLPAIESTIRPSTFRSYKQHVECHICPHIGFVRMQKLSGAQINALYAKLAVSGKRDGKTGLSAQSIRHTHATLHHALKDAVRWERITRNPADAADPPRMCGSGSHEMKTWDARQLAAFLGATRSDRLGGLWHVLAMTGMRRGEALGLRWEDVDLEAGRISVRRALIPNGKVVVVSEPKTARGRRSIALDPETVLVLRAQAARQLSDQQSKGEEWRDTGLVFTKEDGEAWHPEVASRFFRQAVRRAALPTIRLHDLRHTHATLALRAGIHPKVVSERLGHATISITLDTYSHAIPAMQEEAAALIAELVFASSPTTS